jgi:hypothetical protein
MQRDKAVTCVNQAARIQGTHGCWEANCFGHPFADRSEPLLAILDLQHKLDVRATRCPRTVSNIVSTASGFLRDTKEVRSKKCTKVNADSRMPKYLRGRKYPARTGYLDPLPKHQYLVPARNRRLEERIPSIANQPRARRIIAASCHVSFWQHASHGATGKSRTHQGSVQARSREENAASACLLWRQHRSSPAWPCAPEVHDHQMHRLRTTPHHSLQ